MMELVRKNGPVIHLNLLGRSYVLLHDPDDIKVSQLIKIILLIVCHIIKW